MSNDLQDRAGFVYVSTAPTARIPEPWQAVVRITHEHAPELEGCFGLPRPQAGVFKLGYDRTAMGRQAWELRDAERPERAFAEG
jgi:hypothetical protein